MNKKEVAHILEQIGIMLDLKGENPFKTRAYFNGARIIETMNADITELVESGELGNIKGIGKALAEKISTLVTTGELPYFNDLKTSTPAGLLDMLRIPGLGAKKVKVIYEKLKIASIGELEYACRENRLRDLDGFGEKSQEKILQNIELQKKYSELYLFPVAEEEANSILNYLKQNTAFIRLEIAGSLRRKKETIKDLDFVASCSEENRQSLMEYFCNYSQVESVVARGNTKSTIKLNSGINADLRLVQDREFPFALHHSTGSKEHNTAMRSLAKSKNLKMNEYGLFQNDKLVPCASEEEIFKKLGLQYIPPEMRENIGEIESSAQNKLPQLYDGTPFYGIFHVHTTYSDGANTIEEMANACQQMGLQYIGICDHSKSAFYANGLNEERVLKQHDEIDKLNAKNKKFKIFKGIEVDILADGKLDFSDDFLKNFDFVIASVHSIFGLSEEAMTKRICKAVENPFVTMLGHPTGRLLLGREAYKVNMHQVIETAGKHGKIIEINSSPYRLDLDWRLIPFAKSKGIKTALNPDAHSIAGLTEYKYGINIARKGGYEKNQILNSYPLDDVDKIINEIHKKN